MNKSKMFLIGFGVASAGELFSTIGDYSIHYICKPLILLMLIGYYLSSTEVRNSTLLRALFFCWVGDFILMFGNRGELYFMLGLIAFLIGHVFYIFTFRQVARKEQSTLLPTQKVRYSLPIFLSGTGLITILYPGLGALRLPVIVYATILMVMVSTALFRMGRTNSKSFIWVFIGAIFFMLSDSLLAINKFYASFSLAHFYIMLTYVGAQYCIVRGLLLHPAK